MDSSVSLRTPSSHSNATLSGLKVPDGDLRLAGTAALGTLPAGDERLAALQQACALLEQLEAERRRLDERLITGNRKDPMRVVTGKTCLDEAVENTRDLIKQLDDLLCEAAETARKSGQPQP